MKEKLKRISFFSATRVNIYLWENHLVHLYPSLQFLLFLSHTLCLYFCLLFLSVPLLVCFILHCLAVFVSLFVGVSFLGSDPDRGQSPVEWEDFPCAVRPPVHSPLWAIQPGLRPIQPASQVSGFNRLKQTKGHNLITVSQERLGRGAQG